ncbi:MAG TPA: hypothetical protein PLS90_16040 [Candidatus Sumerlaeota bacterium]|nr:hypothetical protein [Candidatus Sumerlaeota bacterium]HPK03959.1 hypothetical protein [Candidatus Sumerlaeota bacterium]
MRPWVEMAPGAAVSIHGLGIEPLTRFWNMRGSDDPTPGVSLRTRFHGGRRCC